MFSKLANFKPTQIIATLGPASETMQTIQRMIKGGMRVARLNFSHGSYINHALLIKNIRAAAKRLKKQVLILQDLQGPKIRVKKLPKTLIVKKGQKVIIGKDFVFDQPIEKSFKKGDRVFIQDGLIELRVSKIRGSTVECLVINGGQIQSHKGVNFPDTQLHLPSFTDKDLQDLKWGLEKKVDMVATSFVRNAEDVKLVRKEIKRLKPGGVALPKIVAKIEKPEAVRNIHSIIRASDMIMIARGDLGVEMPEEQVPLVQNKIVKLCRKAKKPVIVATQMLESMIQNSRPTRAEVSDVADAVLDGADFVMLSEETTTGKYPVEVVKEMQKIITVTSQSKTHK